MNSKQVIRTYIVIASLYTLSASLIWGVNTLFLLDAGLDIFEVFVANAVFTASMVIFEIPTGVVADTSGRRISFLLSTTVLCLATLGYVGVAMMGGGLFWFCVMSVFLGLGFTFYSGAVEAWLVDALHATQFEGELERVFAQAGMVTSGLMLVGTVGGGLLGNLDLALPYVGRALLLAIVTIWAYVYMHDIGYTPRTIGLSAIPTEMRKIAREGIIYGWQKQPIRLLMLMTLIHGLYGIWGFYAAQPYFLDLLGQPDAVWVSGVVAALVALTGILGGWLVNQYMSRFRLRTTVLLGAAGLMSMAVITVGLVNSFWLAVPIFLLGILASNIILPVKQAFLHQSIPSAQRATVISFDSLMSSAGGMVGQTGLGYLARQQDIATGYVVGGAATALAIPVLLVLRGSGDSADVIKSNEHLG